MLEIEASPEERFAAEVLRQARVRPHLCAEDIAWLIFGLGNVLEQLHVDLVTSIFLDAGLDPNGILDDSDTTLVIELIEQHDLFNHGRERTTSGDWEPLEPVEQPLEIVQVDDFIAVASPHGERSRKRYVERPRKHGTAYTYTKLHCRCAECLAWKRTENARQYADRKTGRLAKKPAGDSVTPNT